jgi:hypothetical protein
MNNDSLVPDEEHDSWCEIVCPLLPPSINIDKTSSPLPAVEDRLAELQRGQDHQLDPIYPHEVFYKEITYMEKLEGLIGRRSLKSARFVVCLV